MIKIIVVDDHDLVRMGIARMLSDIEGFMVVGEAKSGEDALKLVNKTRPHIVLMDVKMPGMGGIEATKKLLALDNDIRVIAVTSCDDDIYPTRLIQAGAMGYITKGAAPAEMISAIKTVMDGKPFMSSEIAQQLALKSSGGMAREVSPFEQLSERELQTAMMIVQGEKVTSIADTFCVSPKTINSYRYRIFEKLSVNSDVELAILAVKHKMFDVDAMH